MNEATKVAEQAGIKPRQRRRPIDTEFTERMRDIAARASRLGISISELCRRTDTARATPDRWMRRPPKSIETMAAFERELDKAEAEASEEKF